MSKFHIYSSPKGYRWELKASNGEVVASSQWYTSKEGAIRGCEATRRAAKDAVVIDPET